MGKKTPERLKIIYDNISRGMNQRDSAIMAGIDESTLYNWKKDGSSFSSELDKRELAYKRSLIENIQQASKGKQWQAGAWLLERKFKMIPVQKIEEESVQKIYNINLGGDGGESTDKPTEPTQEPIKNLSGSKEV